MAETSRPSTSSRILTSALRCLDLIDDFVAAKAPLSIGEIAVLTGDRKSTVHQRVQTLVSAGWVEQMPDSRYRLTLKSLFVGSAALDQVDLGTRVLPALQQLAAATGETSTLNALKLAGPVVIQQVRTNQALKVDVGVGTLHPLDRSAAGRALAAFASAFEIEQAIQEGGILPSEEVLSATRRQGYGLQQGEHLPGMSSVALVLDPTSIGSVALAVTAPSTRFNLDRILPALYRARDQINAELST